MGNPGDAYIDAVLEELERSWPSPPKPEPEKPRKTWHERLLEPDPWEEPVLIRRKPKKKGPEPCPGFSDRRSLGAMQYFRHGCRFAVAALLFFSWGRGLGPEFLILGILILALAIESVRMDLKPDLKKRWTGR